MGTNNEFCDECGASTYIESKVEFEDKSGFLFVRRCPNCGENKTSEC